MVGSVTVVDYPVDVMGDDDDIAEYESDDSFDNETYERVIQSNLKIACKINS